MPEFVPPPPGSSDPLEEDEPQAATVFEQMGERLVNLFTPAGGDAARGFLTGAIVEGLGTAIGRVFLAFAVPGFCLLLIAIWGLAAREIGNIGGHLPAGMKFLLGIVGAIGAITAWILSMADTERKGLKMNWVIFITVAAGTLSAIYESGPVLAMLTAQFCVHWIIHSGLRLHQRRDEWLWRAGRQEARLTRTSMASPFKRFAGLQRLEDSKSRPAEKPEPPVP